MRFAWYVQTAFYPFKSYSSSLWKRIRLSKAWKSHRHGRRGRRRRWCHSRLRKFHLLRRLIFFKSSNFPHSDSRLGKNCFRSRPGENKFVCLWGIVGKDQVISFRNCDENSMNFDWLGWRGGGTLPARVRISVLLLFTDHVTLLHQATVSQCLEKAVLQCLRGPIKSGIGKMCSKTQWTSLSFQLILIIFVSLIVTAAYKWKEPFT